MRRVRRSIHQDTNAAVNFDAHCAWRTLRYVVTQRAVALSMPAVNTNGQHPTAKALSYATQLTSTAWRASAGGIWISSVTVCSAHRPLRLGEGTTHSTRSNSHAVRVPNHGTLTRGWVKLLLSPVLLDNGIGLPHHLRSCGRKFSTWLEASNCERVPRCTMHRTCTHTDPVTSLQTARNDPSSC